MHSNIKRIVGLIVIILSLVTVTTAFCGTIAYAQEPVKEEPMSGFTDPAPEEMCNINTATAEELAMKLFRVGPKIAAAIVAYREENGPFKTIEDLTKVMRVGPKTIENNRRILTVGEVKKEESTQ